MKHIFLLFFLLFLISCSQDKVPINRAVYKTLSKECRKRKFSLIWKVIILFKVKANWKRMIRKSKKKTWKVEGRMRSTRIRLTQTWWGPPEIFWIARWKLAELISANHKILHPLVIRIKEEEACKEKICNLKNSMAQLVF